MKVITYQIKLCMAAYKFKNACHTSLMTGRRYKEKIATQFKRSHYSSPEFDPLYYFPSKTLSGSAMTYGEGKPNT